MTNHNFLSRQSAESVSVRHSEGLCAFFMHLTKPIAFEKADSEQIKNHGIRKADSEQIKKTMASENQQFQTPQFIQKYNIFFINISDPPSSRHTLKKYKDIKNS